MTHRALSTATLTLCVASVLVFRLERGMSGEPTANPAAAEIEYLCVGPVAVALGDEKRAALVSEKKLDVPFAAVRRGCRPPLLPVDESALVAAVTSPRRGYGAVLERHAGQPTAVVAGVSRRLESAGWRMTPGTVRMRDLGRENRVVAHEREGGWLLSLAVPAFGGSGSLLLMAGEWAPAR